LGFHQIDVGQAAVTHRAAREDGHNNQGSEHPQIIAELALAITFHIEALAFANPLFIKSYD
jgi:hypothetical protein